MRTSSKGIRIGMGMVVVIVGAVGAAWAFQSSLSQDTAHQEPTNLTSYATNESKQTYGSAETANFDELLPDLIHVGFVDGTAGYVRKQDYLNELGGDVPLYEADGKTIIGSFHISAKNVRYAINDNGQTYGSSADAASPDMEPDLISATGVDGTNGYVFKTDLDGVMPKSPKEALEQQKNRPAAGRDIPLYDQEGTTVIGTFHIS
ncbi:hypothetical protein H8B09_12950 [Paenibacillus sp. PR3]|uniref:Secreted protein n=1 Tax=Paenibacillus terricola TaxID=2763503 RepID=A0ABR8MXN2_9BACL|nr:hypothetical protein [Paenibacillus terricola]MBD3919665.1 hypothetical protein [Paenibacillus terricola]